MLAFFFISLSTTASYIYFFLLGSISVLSTYFINLFRKKVNCPQMSFPLSSAKLLLPIFNVAVTEVFSVTIDNSLLQ